jgi:hypothetical protein
MANYCAGVTVTWNGTSLGEVTDIKVTHGGQLPIGRAAVFAVDAGSVEIASLSTAGGGFDSYGKKSTLQFSGGGQSFSTKAIVQTFDIAGKVNDVWRYRSVFRIVKE